MPVEPYKALKAFGLEVWAAEKGAMWPDGIMFPDKNKYRSILKEYVPILSEAKRTYLQAVAQVADLIANQQQGTDLLEPLSKDEEARSRYARTYKPKDQFRHLGPRWGTGISLCFDLLPIEVAEEVMFEFKKWKVLQCRWTDLLKDSFKEVTTVIKKYGDQLFPKTWKYYINWEVLGGYVDIPDLSIFEEDLREWLTGEIKHELPDESGKMSEDYFLNSLEEGIDYMMSRSPIKMLKPEQYVTWEVFANTPALWGGSGASSEGKPTTFNDYDGVVKKTGKNKWLAALLYITPDRIYKELSTDIDFEQENRALIKRETVKARAIVMADNRMFRRQHFISLTLEHLLHGNELSTLFMSSTQVIDMWKKLVTTLGTRNSWRVPLDQSHFDWYQTRPMIARAISSIEKFLKRQNPPNLTELLITLQIVKKSLTVGGVVTLRKEDGKEVIIPIEKGIVSGWRWTALLDTFLNFGTLYAVAKYVNRRTSVMPVISSIAQGDDDQVTSPNMFSATLLPLGYKLANFDINAKKFFISGPAIAGKQYCRDEYLRIVAEKDKASGYPIRAVVSTLIRSPITRDEIAGILRVTETVNNWNLLIARGMDMDNCIHHMYIDVSAGNKIGMKEIKELLHTPTAMGGLGFYQPDIHLKWVKLSPGRTAIRGVSFDIKQFKPIVLEQAQWSEKGIIISDHDARKRITELIPFESASKTKVIGSVTPVSLDWYEDIHTELTAKLPTKGATKLGNSLFNMEVLNKLIRLKAWDSIQNDWLQEDLIASSDIIRRKSSRRVWLNWLQGKLPFSPPILAGKGQLVITTIYKEVSESYFYSCVYARGSTSMKQVISAAIQAEEETRRRVRNEPITLGI